VKLRPLYEKVKTGMLTLVVPMYISAAAGFALGILRDFSIFHYTTYATDYFKAYYLASAISVFSINTLTLSGKKVSYANIRVLAFTTIILFAVSTFYVHSSLSVINQLGSLSLALIWIYGAFEANDAFLDGRVILAKTREAFSSFITSVIAIFNPIVLLTILIGPILSILPFSQKALARSLSSHSKESKANYSIFLSAILTSAAPLTLQYWAYMMTNIDGLIFGFSYPVFIRIATYLFQFVSVGSSILVFVNVDFVRRNSGNLLVISLVLSLISYLTVTSVMIPAVVAVPIVLGVTHIVLIFFSLSLSKAD